MKIRRVARIPAAAGRRVHRYLERRIDEAGPIPSAPEVLANAVRSHGDAQALLRSLRAGERFFFSPPHAATIADELSASVPGWRDRTISDADRLLTRVVRILGADAVELARGGTTLPWHEDLFTGYRWNPTTFFKDVEIPYDRADIKVPWELSRSQHLPTLGMAYAITGDDRYAREVVFTIEDWIASNRPRRGVNWACAMDVAIRAVNWLWAYHLVAQAPQATEEFSIRFASSLIAHARHIARNIERYENGVTTNHTLADYVGLLYLAVELRGVPEAERWEREALQGIAECMQVQVQADGVDFENSIPYHRLVLEMFVAAYVFAEKNQLPLPTDFRLRLEQMFEFVYHYTRPDGLAPLIGDNDDGRLHVLSRYFDWNPQDHRYLLAIGGVLFDRDDLLAAVRSPTDAEDAAWLLGPSAVHRLAVSRDQAPRRQSHAFTDSGRYVVRHGDHHAIISADEVGSAGLGNHKHNDIFSFELSLDGTAMFVDPGSYVYTRDLSSRDRFRSTSAHNTVMVDAIEQNEIVGPFGMRGDARVNINAWRSDQAFDFFDGEHTGYERLAQPVRHRRRIACWKEPFAWLVIDTLLGTGRHTIHSSLHMSPRARADRLEPDETTMAYLDSSLARVLPLFAEELIPNEKHAVACTSAGATALVVPVNWSGVAIENGWVAPRYGRREHASVLVLSGDVECGATFGFLVVRQPR